MPHATHYRHIAAWGRLMNSHQSYIIEQQALAAFDNAPLNAIFSRFSITEPKPTRTRVWATFDDVTAPDVRASVERFLAEQPMFQAKGSAR